MYELALFAGAGGGLLASKILGWSTIAAVELAAYPRGILAQRQEEGFLEPFPIWDIRTFDGIPWAGVVDVVSGGFPCQDISASGMGAGLAGERSGLWTEYRRVVEECRPSFVFAENSPLLRTRGLGTIIKDLDELGYDVRWCVLGAGHFGAVHKRARMWVAAHVRCNGGQRLRIKEIPRKSAIPWSKDERRLAFERGGSPVHTPKLYGVGDGVANRVDRAKAIGNGQVPIVAAKAWNLLTHDL